MIVARVQGGLGNQLFIYAFGRYLACKYNTELKLDTSLNDAYKDSHHDFYKLDNFNIKAGIATTEEMENLNFFVPRTFYFEPEDLNCPDNSIIDGYYQSGSYFDDPEVEKILREELTLKNPLGKNSATWEKKILSAECAVSVHFRLTDYATPLQRSIRGNLSRHYYADCIAELKKLYPQMTLFVFSDDWDRAKKILPDNLDVPFEIVTGCEKSFEEMYLMSICKHNIISNGTFAWWGAWLNKNPDKKVFAPAEWNRGGWCGDTAVPESWIKINSRFDDNSNFPPFLSIIFCVENNSAETAFNLSTALSQNFQEFKTFIPDFEVVIADISEGGGAKLSRNFAGHDKVTYLNLGENFNKISAWNRGLENARGEYVLFLSDKDFMFPQVVKTLSHAWEDVFRNSKYKEKQDWIRLKNYDYIGSDIVCATQYFQEDDEGENIIHGLNDKKFSLKIDAPFVNLNSIVEVQIADAHKLQLLASGQVNNLLSTKFFKRVFLEENFLRFSEQSRGGGHGICRIAFPCQCLYVD